MVSSPSTPNYKKWIPKKQRTEQRTRAQKDAWGGDIRKLPMGMPGAQTLLAAAYTYGVKTGKISLPRLVELLCENPARVSTSRTVSAPTPCSGV